MPWILSQYSIILFVIICLEAGCIAFVNINQEKYITGSDDEKYEKERKLTDMCLAMYILLGIEVTIRRFSENCRKWLTNVIVFERVSVW